ncbi:MAG: alkylmercury lyase MerB [Nannocystales bacterium]
MKTEDSPHNGRGLTAEADRFEHISRSLLAASTFLDGAQAALTRTVYRALVQGAPVSIDTVAATAGFSADRAEELLAQGPGLTRDDRGAIVGYGGLTLRETKHQFRIDGKRLYTWCALDALFLPVVIGRGADVVSISPTTGETVRVRVEADGTSTSALEGVMVSFVTPQTPLAADVRARFCCFVHFFESRDVAEQWATTQSDIEILSLSRASELGRRLTYRMFGAAPEPVADAVTPFTIR